MTLLDPLSRLPEYEIRGKGCEMQARWPGVAARRSSPTSKHRTFYEFAPLAGGLNRYVGVRHGDVGPRLRAVVGDRFDLVGIGEEPDKFWVDTRFCAGQAGEFVAGSWRFICHVRISFQDLIVCSAQE